MNFLFILLSIAVMVTIVYLLSEKEKKAKKQISSKKEARNGTFDERGRFVRDVANNSKIGHIVVDTNKTRTFSRNNEKDLVQDPPLSEAERNVLLGR